MRPDITSGEIISSKVSAIYSSAISVICSSLREVRSTAKCAALSYRRGGIYQADLNDDGDGRGLQLRPSDVGEAENHLLPTLANLVPPVNLRAAGAASSKRKSARNYRDRPRAAKILCARRKMAAASYGAWRRGNRSMLAPSARRIRAKREYRRYNRGRRQALLLENLWPSNARRAVG